MVFPVVVYGCQSWTVKKAEHRRIDAFELWCWRRLLRVPLTARRSNQSILKEISPGCSLEGLMLKLKLRYFGHLMWRVDSLEKTPILGGIRGRRMLGASVRNSTRDKVMRQSSDGKANQTSGFPPGISWASTPPIIRICLLFHSSNILCKKSNQGFSLLHLKGMFQVKPPLITL